MALGEGRSLYWSVTAVNAAMFAAAAGVLVLSPATVSEQVTDRELAVLLVGVVVVAVVNALLLRGQLRPLDRLAGELRSGDVHELTWRLPSAGRSGVERSFVSTVNVLLDRLVAERLATAASARAAEEAERRRIARELHDEVGQRLTVVLLGLGRIGAHVDDCRQSELALVTENTRESLETVRGVAEGLRGDVWEDLDLFAALNSLCATFEAASGLAVTSRFDDSVSSLPNEAAQVVFRVAQEALTNVARHASATTVELVVERSELGGRKVVDLVVSDDGTGYRPGSAGFGIAGMRHRATEIGGTLTVQSRVRGGTEVRLHAPAGGAAPASVDHERRVTR